MMNIKTIFCIPLLLLMSNCKTQTSSKTETSTVTNNIVTIGLDKQVKIPNSKVSLQFKEVVEESRCPVDVTCVWEGIAIVNVEATSGSEKMDFKVATRDFLPKNVTKTFSFSGYKFTLTELKPQPGAKEEPATVSFKFEKE
ncbi:hypothetical protein NG800_001860 [Epilithonimonas ginsengisoli]|uniref:Lipoprotein n=1 Tax=Epilithonimonas ginsengisoli TaxID=1245592 RepID=A0ABU4JDL4_9FLAO|nr:MULTISPECIES: hypothetical protein [Chryseobacterium group]MBV6878611.1 hypothetical protein [Epilithonimonas sp. FP105]MDW8547636.1 hypothetical protein [Epilithonimonas ginsengisoli]